MPIQLLDDNLINQIAAGEVIEKPASVVKELVENAIDAGATRIKVKIIRGGIETIEVEDNGCGMTKDELPLALERHATSKISSASDLFNICTLGFRGEALPSIASVARVDIYSKKSGHDGVHIAVAGGKILEILPCACPDGTRVLVRDLFYNTPARKKFLKSPVSEANNIHELMVRLALSRPDISMSYENEKKTYFKSPGQGNLMNTIISLYGQDFSAGLIPVNYQGESYAISGMVSTPEKSRANRRNQIFFVNNRPIRSPMLYKAVDEGYRGLLISREFPVALLKIKVPPEEIDVNVHPQKIEVRFKDEKTVFKLVSGVLRNTLEDISYQFTGEVVSQPRPLAASPVQPYLSAGNRMGENFLTGWKTPDRSNDGITPNGSPFEDSDITQVNESSPLGFRIIGQFLNSYILMEQNQELWLVDQHAAQERVNYERLKAQHGPVPSQLLAIPLTLQINARQMQLLERNSELLAKLGLEVGSIGIDTVVLRAAPIYMQGQELEVINELLDLLEEDKVVDLEHEAIAMMACKKAVKAGECLTRAEMEKIINDLLAVDNFRNCPHGRPTMLCISRQEIDRHFKRH
ncbi:MAG: DNA mismatch repair endonuclease MutL [Syntrophomonadaceae bacterium]|jgi:DNA mismatch repair protein MutL